MISSIMSNGWELIIYFTSSPLSGQEVRKIIVVSVFLNNETVFGPIFPQFYFL